jgi:hypothetical protein
MSEQHRTPYRLYFELEGLPAMANIKSGKSHWRHAHKEATRWQHLVWAAVSNKRPIAPLQRVRLTLTRFSSVEPDYDGLTRGFKSIVDGLVKAGVLANDKLSNTGAWNCYWHKAPRGKGKVLIIVEEMPS